MGTGAVYVTLFSLKDRAEFLEAVETGLYFLNVAIFMLNSTTLLLQAIRKCTSYDRNQVSEILLCLVYPRKARRLLTDPTTGIFVPLIVCKLFTAPSLSL